MRANGKSSFQIKKEKLQRIKAEIQSWRDIWIRLRRGEIPEKTPKTAADEIEILWNIIRDE